MRTEQEIKDKYEKWKGEFFAFRGGDILEALPLEVAKPYLRADFDREWRQLKTDDDVRAQILDYLPFAWGKANKCRALSALRSLSHFSAWLWLLGEDELSESIMEYTLYGKPELVKISEKFGFDWRAYDNDEWTDDERGSGITADEYFKRQAA
jgi:hypothetical protein